MTRSSNSGGRTEGRSAGRRRRDALRKDASSGPSIEQLPFAQTVNPVQPMELLSEQSLVAIENASFDILENIGVNFLLPEARQLLAAAGAEVDPDTDRVRLDRNLIIEMLDRAPSEFPLHARNPAHNLNIGGRNICFTAVSSPPNVSCMDKGRRTGNFTDYCNLLKLIQRINVAQMTVGHPVEPVDVPTALRHLQATQAKIELTDKVFGLYSLGRQRVVDVLEMVAMMHGRTRDSLIDFPCTFTNVNANSPLQFGPVPWHR